MDREEQEILFRRARIALHQGMLSEANAMFAELLQASDSDARFLSYRGLLMAIRERRVSEGAVLCMRAVALASTEPEMVLNLSRLYATSGQHERAVETLRRAIRGGLRTESILEEIQRLSPRAEPPIPSLHRDHLLNDVLGKLRAKLLGKRARRAPVKPRTATARRALLHAARARR